jgi:beta-lactamase superfamily II metal-dependent hydrolase
MEERPDILKLNIVQAKFGDCMILEFGSEEQKPHYILIDGGPEGTYDNHLSATLQSIRPGGDGSKKTLDIIIASHVDDDHVIGLIDFLADLRHRREEAEISQMDDKNIISVGSLWHNSFSKTLQEEQGQEHDMASRSSNNSVNIHSRVESLLERMQYSSSSSSFSSKNNFAAAKAAIMGIGEGRQLHLLAGILGIVINPGFPKGLVLVEEKKEEEAPNPIKIDNLTLRIIGPTKANLEELRNLWRKWLEKYETADISEPSIAAVADKSIPNLSSIVVLAEADGKRVLITGDARGDHIIDGLRLAGGGLFDDNDDDGHMHVDVLKVPHHGSARNVTKAFFKALTSDIYIISADGRYGNPDFSTLKWIVEAAQERQSTIKIIATNETPAIRKLIQDYPQEQSGYSIMVMDKNADYLDIQVV